jgi:hypothetical protein
MKNSRQIKFKKSLGKQTSLPRAKQKALGTEKNTRQIFLYQEPNKKLSGKKILKNHFFASNFFFYPQHTLIQNLCSNLA